MTADALNCQHVIAEQIVTQKGDYALALKGNQGTLDDDVVLFLDDPESQVTTAQPVVEGDHGRIETRTATVSTEMAEPECYRQSRSRAPNGGENHHRNRLLSAQVVCYRQNDSMKSRVNTGA